MPSTPHEYIDLIRIRHVHFRHERVNTQHVNRKRNIKYLFNVKHGRHIAFLTATYNDCDTIYYII